MCSSTGGTISISGSGFGSSTGTVSLGSETLSVTSWSDSAIDAVVGVSKAGDLDLQVETASGLAVDR